MIKKRDRIINYGQDKSLRVVWFRDPEQRAWFSFSLRKHYKTSKFWKPVRRKITLCVFNYNFSVEILHSLTKHRKK